MGELFLQMLPDSDTASCFRALRGTKIGYMVMYGLAQYFRSEILQELRPGPRLPPNITPLFDESHNKVKTS